jgi:hypothetical protein
MEDNNKMDHRETGYVDLAWIHMAQDWDKVSCCENANELFSSSIKGRDLNERLLASHEELCFMTLSTTLKI